MTLKDKIAALLAKAESSTHPEERDAFNAKAEQLMLKHGIEQAELEATGQASAEPIERKMMPFKGSYASAMGVFVNRLAMAMGNLTVYQSRWQQYNDVYIVGHASDLDRAFAIITSLHVQATSAMQSWWRNSDERHYLNRQEGWKARRQYLLSFAAGAAARIRRERRAVEATASAGAELVLVSKQAKVDAWLADNVQLGQARPSRRQGSTHGAAEGYEAGRNADVGTNRISR